MKSVKKIISGVSVLLLIAFVLTIEGCSSFRGVKTYAPTYFGMERIADHVFVDKTMQERLRSNLLVQYKVAENNIRIVYGDIQTHPNVVACSTENCFRRFGGNAERAKSFGSDALLLSPRALTAPLISHEWSHNELYSRFDDIKQIPTWFDEGLAVTISKEPTQSEKAWLEIIASGIPTPKLDELTTLEDWLKAVNKYGEHKIIKENPRRLKAVYATAGHEVRPWLNCAGSKGLLELIKLTNSGKNFYNSYKNIVDNNECIKNT